MNRLRKVIRKNLLENKLRLQMDEVVLNLDTILKNMGVEESKLTIHECGIEGQVWVLDFEIELGRVRFLWRLNYSGLVVDCSFGVVRESTQKPLTARHTPCGDSIYNADTQGSGCDSSSIGYFEDCDCFDSCNRHGIDLNAPTHTIGNDVLDYYDNARVEIVEDMLFGVFNGVDVQSKKFTDILTGLLVLLMGGTINDADSMWGEGVELLVDFDVDSNDWVVKVGSVDYELNSSSIEDDEYSNEYCSDDDLEGSYNTDMEVEVVSTPHTLVIKGLEDYVEEIDTIELLKTLGIDNITHELGISIEDIEEVIFEDNGDVILVVLGEEVLIPFEELVVDGNLMLPIV